MVKVVKAVVPCNPSGPSSSFRNIAKDSDLVGVNPAYNDSTREEFCRSNHLNTILCCERTEGGPHYDQSQLAQLHSTGHTLLVSHFNNNLS